MQLIRILNFCAYVSENSQMIYSQFTHYASQFAYVIFTWVKCEF